MLNPEKFIFVSEMKRNEVHFSGSKSHGSAPDMNKITSAFGWKTR
ncbi:hypothetical protein MAMP_00523 [Methylophaga aminisulfidivorans MP]|uniref:Uncharacterized protein n=1 Tax=Methylophaga aminisulfidivorans MP TaxID=1026882 RepID=F5SYC9_9GAMM|nr:hypothetical protein MAMP_00523 [Methylophaga aminisulfidivorans MP]